MKRTPQTYAAYRNTDYIIVKYGVCKVQDLCEEVDRLKGEGFDCVGGLCSCGEYILQAMIHTMGGK